MLNSFISYGFGFSESCCLNIGFNISDLDWGIVKSEIWCFL